MKKRRREYNTKTVNEIPLKLNDYSNIFSELGPRAYSHRALSSDFLLECRKASIEKKKDIQLKLLLPSSKRDVKLEEEIKGRLRDHFNKHHHEKKHDLRNLNLTGMFWFILGAVLIVVTAIIMERSRSLLMNIIINIAQPGGWFFLWEGMGKILLTSRERRSDYSFYKKMDEAEIIFDSI